jgi:hypothetical protein
MRVVAAGLVFAISAVAGGSVFSQAAHPICVAKHHDCGQIARMSSCCCGDQDVSRNDSTPGQSRTDVRPDMSVTPSFSFAVYFATGPNLASAIQTSPPRLCSLDLPTLFAALLI